jgi:uncharacterized protein (AIM24 family)
MKMHSDVSGGRILLGYNTGSGAVVLQPISFGYFGV